MTDTRDDHGDLHRQSVPAGEVLTWPLPPSHVPAPPRDGGHPLRWVQADPETLARVRAALQQL